MRLIRLPWYVYICVCVCVYICIYLSDLHSQGNHGSIELEYLGEFPCITVKGMLCSRCVYCFALFPHCCPCSEAQQRAFHLQQTENADRFVALWSWGSFPCCSYQLPWKDVKCYSTAFMEIMNKNQGKQYRAALTAFAEPHCCVSAASRGKAL